MEIAPGREGDWVSNVLATYCKQKRLHASLERAEINPKKRMTTNTYDSSTDVFKMNLVYKDNKGSEHELRWLIKCTRSDINETADILLRHEKQVFSMVFGDLINTVKQRAAGRTEEERKSHKELLDTPEFIFDETQHQSDVLRNVLVLDNLEEKLYASAQPPLNLAHLRIVVKTVAKFHAVSLCYKKTIFDSFVQHSEQVQASKNMDDVEIEGENMVLTGRMGLFDRFPFLTQRLKTMNHLVKNRVKFLDMYQKLLEMTLGESESEACLIDTFEYIRMSTDDILRLNEHVEDPDMVDHPLDTIALGVLEARSFLFNYEKPKSDNSGGTKLQRSQSERRVKKDLGASPPKKIPLVKKVAPSLEKQKSLPKNSKFQNIFQSRAKDDATLKTTLHKKVIKPVIERDPNAMPMSAALVNGKYVTYTRVTRDLACLFFTSTDSLVRRFYLVKVIETYCEALYTALWQLGINPDSYGMNYHSVINDFQQHVLYGFMIGILIGMANTDPVEIDKMCNPNKHDNPGDNANGEANATTDKDSDKSFIPLTEHRIQFLVDLMRDIAFYVESKDFELGLPITNFRRYHELWEMKVDIEKDEGDENYEYESYEEEDEDDQEENENNEEDEERDYYDEE